MPIFGLCQPLAIPKRPHRGAQGLQGRPVKISQWPNPMVLKPTSHQFTHHKSPENLNIWGICWSRTQLPAGYLGWENYPLSIPRPSAGWGYGQHRRQRRRSSRPSGLVPFYPASLARSYCKPLGERRHGAGQPRLGDTKGHQAASIQATAILLVRMAQLCHWTWKNTP